MSETVTLVECAREGWRGLRLKVPAEVKADYLRVLVAAGFTHIDAVSFGSKAMVAERSQAELVLEYADPPDDVEMMGLVVDAEGTERAAKTGAVQTVRFPYSVSAGALQRMYGWGLEEAVEALEGVGEAAYKAGMEVVVEVGMAFGGPAAEAWDVDEVVAACDLLVDSGVRQIVLVDSAGIATPRVVADVLADTTAVHDGVEIGVHLQALERWPELVAAAYGAGCRRFEGVIGGGGGFAAEGMAGSLPTERMVEELRRMGAVVPELRPLEGLVAANAEILRRYGAKVQ